MNKDKMKTMAFSNLIGSIIFLAIGIWAWFQTDKFPEVANTYVQASTFPRVMIVGMVIFAAILLLQSIIKLMGAMKPTDPEAAEVSTLNPLKDKGLAGRPLLCQDRFGGEKDAVPHHSGHLSAGCLLHQQKCL